MLGSRDLKPWGPHLEEPGSPLRPHFPGHLEAGRCWREKNKEPRGLVIAWDKAEPSGASADLPRPKAPALFNPPPGSRWDPSRLPAAPGREARTPERAGSSSLAALRGSGAVRQGEAAFAEEFGERRWGSQGRKVILTLASGLPSTPWGREDWNILLRHLHRRAVERPALVAAPDATPAAHELARSRCPRELPHRVQLPALRWLPLRVRKEGPHLFLGMENFPEPYSWYYRGGRGVPILNHCFLHSRYGTGKIFSFQRKQVIVCELSSAVKKVSQFKEKENSFNNFFFIFCCKQLRNVFRKVTTQA